MSVADTIGMHDDERDLQRLIRQMAEERAADHEAYTREREALALLVLTLDRQVADLLVTLGQARQRLADSSPPGRPVG